MTNEEILEGNKLITEFDGWNKAELKDFVCKIIGKEQIYLHISSLRYDEDWSLLMPVVEKITSLGFRTEVVIYKSGSDVFIINEDQRLNIVAYSKTIDAVWQAVVQFIKWYNKNKLPKQPIQSQPKNKQL